MQIALFVTPSLVILGWIIGENMTFHFEVFETVVFFLSVLVVNCKFLPNAGPVCEESSNTRHRSYPRRQVKLSRRSNVDWNVSALRGLFPPMLHPLTFH